MSKTRTPDATFLTSVGLNPEAAAKPHQATTEVDPHTMPASEIVFDPALLDEFPDLSAQMKAASTKVFEVYRSYGRDKERNGLLHRRITEFIGQVDRARRGEGELPGFVKTKVKATKKQRDLTRYLAEHGIESIEDLERALSGGE